MNPNFKLKNYCASTALLKNTSTTEESTVISLNFLLWKIFRNSQFPHSFGIIHCPNTEFSLVRIFPHSDWMPRDTPYLSVLVRMPKNTDQKKLRIWTLFISWKRNSVETFRKLCASIKFRQEKTRWDFGILRSGLGLNTLMRAVATALCL